MFLIFDIHSHLIPRIDDGAKNSAESIKMLQILKGEGVDNILATPHFYPERDNLDDFFAARKAGLDSLAAAREGRAFPEIHLGCELLYTRGLADFEALSSLRIEGTDYILIELPYGGISKNVLEDILNFSINFGLTPIFAHLERFGLYKGFKDAVAFVAAGNALAQVNASSFFDKRLKKYATALAKKDLISFLGSDLHSSSGQPSIRQAIGHINMLYPRTSKRLEASAQMLLDAIIHANPGK